MARWRTLHLARNARELTRHRLQFGLFALAFSGAPLLFRISALLHLTENRGRVFDQVVRLTISKGGSRLRRDAGAIARIEQ